ncbi:MAG TPA: signal peptidase I [Pseudogracilibacillus sp.]|nr:signal peptidase I [Pseudogracilibacillus sp.]
MTKRNSNSLVKWIKASLIAIILAIILNTFIFSSSIVEGISMEPTLIDNDRIIFNKLIYIISQPERGDIIIIKQRDKKYIKRVIALPGETIEMSNHKLYIDSVEQPTSYVDPSDEILTGSFGPLKVPKEHYFVMGDNRLVSKDSRNELGLIKRDEIIGKSEFIISPFNRWSRTK